MTAVPYIATALIAGGMGFAACAVWLAERYWTLDGERNRLAIGLSNAFNSLRAAGLHSAADQAFTVLDENGGVQC